MLDLLHLVEFHDQNIGKARVRDLPICSDEVLLSAILRLDVHLRYCLHALIVDSKGRIGLVHDGSRCGRF